MSKPKLSVIIPMWNSKSFILSCLKSVTGYKDIEVIVVDDGSTDDSYSFVKNYFKNIEGDYHVYKRPHEGISLTRKFGVSKSHSDYIAFLDSDDEMNVDAYLNLLKEMKKNRVEVGIGRVKVKTGFITLPSVNLKFGNRVINFKKEHYILSSMLTLITAKIWKKEMLTYYDSKGSANEDVECVPLMLAKAHKVYFTNQAIYTRVNRKGSTSFTDICNVKSTKSLKNTVYPLLALKKRFVDNDLYTYYQSEVDAISMKHFFERIYNLTFSKNLKNKNELIEIVGELLLKVIPEYRENIHYLNHFKRMEMSDYFFYRIAKSKLKNVKKTDSSIEELLERYEKSLN